MALAGPSRSVPTTATSIPKDELLFIPHTHHDGTPRLEDQANRNDGSSRLVEALVLDGGLEEEDLVDGTFKEPELVTDLSSEEEIHEVFLDALAQVTDAMQEMGREAEPLATATAETPNQKRTGPSVGRRVTVTLKKIWTKFHTRPTHDCAACQDPIQHAEIRVPCGHYYDKECIISLFEASTRDESLFHPRCCKEMIPFRSVRKHFSPTLRTIFIEKSREYGTVKRVYCAVPRCSLFLGPQTEGNAPLKVYKCKCGTTTCARCKNAHREGVEHSCKENADQETEAVLVLGKAEGWARCPGCRAMIELNMGCYHMTCLCKAQFCYLCQARWKTCSCPQWDEARLAGAAEERIDIQLQLMEAAQRPAPVLARWRQDAYRNRNRVLNPPLPLTREQLIEAAVNQLRLDHDCQHLGWVYRDGGGRCVGCHDILDRYVFHCLDCHTVACNRCRLNRF